MTMGKSVTHIEIPESAEAPPLRLHPSPLAIGSP